MDSFSICGTSWISIKFIHKNKNIENVNIKNTEHNYVEITEIKEAKKATTK